MIQYQTIEVELRPAQKKDLLIAKGLLRLGQIIYLATPITKELKGPFVIDQYVSSMILKRFFEQNLVYVPTIEMEENIHDLLQLDFKKEAEQKLVNQDV